MMMCQGSLLKLSSQAWCNACAWAGNGAMLDSIHYKFVSKIDMHLDRAQAILPLSKDSCNAYTGVKCIGLITSNRKMFGRRPAYTRFQLSWYITSPSSISPDPWYRGRSKRIACSLLLLRLLQISWKSPSSTKPTATLFVDKLWNIRKQTWHLDQCWR